MAGSNPQSNSDRPLPRVAVIGGGIAGLSAALTLQDAGVDVVLIESSDRLGGKIRTERTGDYIIEAGPDSILSYKPAGLAMIERVGLMDRVINTREGGQGTSILHRGRLQPLPEGMTGLVPADVRSLSTTGLLSWRGKVRLALEYFLPASRKATDESVGGFVRRRLGDEFYRNLAEPLLSGIYAGDADQLSLLATFPRLREQERQYGGLVRSTLAQRRNAQGRSGSRKRSPFISLEGGLGDIIDGLAAALTGVDIRTGTPATAIHHTGNGYRIELGAGAPVDTDAVVLATPAWAAAGLLRRMAPQLSWELDAIPYVSTATITAAYDATAAGDMDVGRGFVIPRAERRMLTAVTASSSKFPGRAPAGALLIRGYAGRANDQESLDRSDDDLAAVFRRELAEITGLAAEPRFTRVYRWPRALPQYNLGHPGRMSRIEALSTEYPGLVLAGAAYRGVGIPDCIQDGAARARDVLDRLDIPGRVHA
ncbi:MAG: protoporphyrinogen oxidase [Thermomicrobiales bacterium]